MKVFNVLKVSKLFSAFKNSEYKNTIEQVQNCSTLHEHTKIKNIKLLAVKTKVENTAKISIREHKILFDEVVFKKSSIQIPIVKHKLFKSKSINKLKNFKKRSSCYQISVSF